MRSARKMSRYRDDTPRIYGEFDARGAAAMLRATTRRFFRERLKRRAMPRVAGREVGR